MMDLQAKEVQGAPPVATIINRNTKRRAGLKCAVCRTAISIRTEYITAEGKTVHVMCTPGAVSGCPTCFLVGPCDCEGR